MSEKEDGGPAFPTFTEQYSYGYDKSRPVTVDPGMSLRDYFAIRTLPMAVECHPDGHARGWVGIAEHAYSIADAMLAAREAA